MSYEAFYHLNEQPFSNAPNDKFFYKTLQHSHALMRLRHAAKTMNGLTLLLGEIGAGKTTLARKMLDELDTDEYEVALLIIIHSQITAEWLLRKIAIQIGVTNVGENKVEILQSLGKRLFELYEQNKKVVVLIDEANMLQSKEIMEEFRGLLNMEMPDRKLISFIFFGLNEMENYLKLDQPLYQRIAMKCRLKGLKLNSTKEYIRHRLQIAGGNADLFTDEAMVKVHEYSKGVPRLINTICENALFSGFLMKKNIIDAQLVSEVAEDFGFKK